MAREVPSIDRALSVLETLARTRRGLTLSDLSRKLKMPKSSGHYVVKTLERRGYVVRDPLFHRFCLGMKLFDLGTVVLDQLDIREIATPYLELLTNETRITSHLAVLDRGEAVFVAKIEAPGMVRIATWVGHRRPINVTAVGKVLAAFLPEDEQEEVLRTAELPKHTTRSIVTRTRFREELKRIRERGFAVDDEEDEIGIRCVAGPILDKSSRTVAAVSLTAPTSQITRENLPELAKVVRNTAAAISAALGRSR